MLPIAIQNIVNLSEYQAQTQYIVCFYFLSNIFRFYTIYILVKIDGILFTLMIIFDIIYIVKMRDFDYSYYFIYNFLMNGG